jgi:hypothetical protein
MEEKMDGMMLVMMVRSANHQDHRCLVIEPKQIVLVRVMSM